MMTEQDFDERLDAQIKALLCYDPGDFREILKERAMPKPLWARRPMTDTADSVLSGVSKAAAESPADTFCIYVHIPYCRTRCGYCDCYSFPLTPSRLPELAAYPGYLEHEIDWWGSHVPELGRKKVSTVHFGGGTPLMTGVTGLSQTVEHIGKYFDINAETELSLESTSSDLNEKILDELQSAGFTRLHIGVQSLRDPVRKAIGRRETGEEVLQKIRHAVKKGWIVSTDIIIGLPLYTDPDIEADLTAMADAGVEGFSIYELVRSPRNRAFFEYHGILDPDITAMWRQYQYAFWLAEERGYSLNIYNHMAKGRDDNRYFTSPARGEDLLSFGTIADGYFGNYLYRHAELDAYRQQTAQGLPGLLGGMERTETESRIARLEREIRHGVLLPDPFIEILGVQNALDLFRTWMAQGFLRVSRDEEKAELYPNGAWFIQKMIDDVSALVS